MLPDMMPPVDRYERGSQIIFDAMNDDRAWLMQQYDHSPYRFSNPSCNSLISLKDDCCDMCERRHILGGVHWHGDQHLCEFWRINSAGTINVTIEPELRPAWLYSTP